MHSQMLEAAGVSSGWLALAAVGVAVVSYFLGCFNGAVVVSRYILRDDIREHGSGNAGLTNFYRVFGGPLTFAVILSDALKAVLAVLFGAFIAGNISPELLVLSRYWAGTFCMIGHMFPCTFQFRGGKGVLSGATVAIMIGIGGGGVLPGWIIPVTVWGGFIVLVAATRYVSLGSCWGGASFIVVSWLVYRDPLILLLATIMGGLLLWGHRGNMVRLAKGTERRFEFHKKNPSPAEGAQGPEEGAAPTEEPKELAGDKPGEEPASGTAPAAEKPAAPPKPEPPEEPAPEPEAKSEPAAEPEAEAEEPAAQPQAESAGPEAGEGPAPQRRSRPRKHKRKNKK